MKRPTLAIVRRAVLAVILMIAAATTPAFAADAGAPRDASGFEDGGADASTIDSDIASLDAEASQVRDLIADKLDLAVTPTSLFEIPIDDDRAVDLDAERLRMLLSVNDGGAPNAKAAKNKALHTDSRMRDAGVLAIDVPENFWTARIDLDRARLDFYELPSARRHELLDAHAKRQAATKSSVNDQEDAKSEAQRHAALEAARDAHTEAERLVATEYTRLLDVDHAQVVFAASLATSRKEIATRREATLGWQRRAQDATAGAPAIADTTYDDLRHALRSARDALSTALDDLSSDSTGVPEAGPDPLANAQIDVDVTAAHNERDHVDEQAAKLTADETQLRADSASQLLDEIDSLNRERLGLLGALSPEKRSAITGFTAAGLDQASSEVRQLRLILRYHRHEVGVLITSLRHPSRSLIGRTLAGSILTIFEWLAVFVGFFWWHRRSAGVLLAWRGNVQEKDRHERLGSPSITDRALGFSLQVHRSLEWLVLLLLLNWFLPATLQSILEIRLITTILEWIFGASFIVSVINALAGGDEKNAGSDVRETARLRLRSLRLVGRVVVVFGLILVISSMLVGHGTIYQWVFSTCWLASLPILLVLVQWWKKVVFRRLELVRKKSPFQKWVLKNSTGWTSFVAATAGGVHLFGTGGVRTARAWVARFDLSRRVLAYLFRRQMDKMVADQEPLVADSLPDAMLALLGPETLSAKWIETEVDAALTRLQTRIHGKKGGIVAIVGGRGMGKTHALETLRADDHDAVMWSDTPIDGLDALRLDLAKALSIDPGASLKDVGAALDASATKNVIFVDNVQRLVRPVMGGLAQFDALLEAASLHSERTTWVFTLDSVIWKFLERSRGARPLFDEIILLRRWREAEIVELIVARTEQAGITPSFDHLLERLPANADEIDRREAIEKRSSDYYRLLWDYAEGNPGVVLDVWRRSLGVDAKGTTCVSIFQALDSADLERLPDHAVFVLRAILQLAPAMPIEIAKATMIRAAEVHEALRYGLARGYLEERDGRYRVTWKWFQPVALFLQRRHLLGS